MTIIDFSTRLPTKSDTRTDLQRSAKQQHTNQGFKKTTPIPTNVTKPQQLAEGSYALTSPRPEPPLQEWSTSNSGVPYNANSEGITLREENMRPVDTTDTKASQTCSKPDLIETTDGEFLAPFEPGHGHGILGNSPHRFQTLKLRWMIVIKTFRIQLLPSNFR